MRTIMLEIQNDSFYDKLISFLNQNRKDVTIVDDGFHAITTAEAKERVAKAVEEYRSGRGVYLNQDEYDLYMANSIENLKSKYADN